MKGFLKKNKISLAIIIGILVLGTTIYFWPKKTKTLKIYKETPQKTCENIPELPDGAVKLVTKIIDGDTFLIENGYSVRILGIDADERDHPCYEPAKNRLEELILNKEVKLEKGNKDKDQYCRYLRYVFLTSSENKNLSEKSSTNVGLELVKEGLAVARASAEDNKYQKEIALAERTAIENQVGCKWSGEGAVGSDKDNVKKEANYQWSKLTPELTGLKVVEACSADEHYGQEVIVEGWVADGYRSKTNTVFLNFERAYPNQCFTAVIFSSDQYRFIQNPEEYYAGQMVRVKGKVKEYKGKPEIILKKAEQIEKGK